MIVNGWTYFLCATLENLKPLTRLVWAMESALLKKRIKETKVKAPVFICGLARSGSTIILEVLNSHIDVKSLQYHHFPFLFMPYIWGKHLKGIFSKEQVPVERIHGDRIWVTAESPEGFEEPVWLTFFPQCHDDHHSNVFDDRTCNSHFEKHYRELIVKLLLSSGKRRYMSKGNYNSTRITYLQKLFPDAKFIIPVRAPVSQVASLIRQHANFCMLHATNPRITRHMKRMGHFEFGPQRKPLNVGSNGAANEVQKLWNDGKDHEAYAHLWADVYGYLADLVERNRDAADAVLFVKYEDLCRNPEHVLGAIFEHAELENHDASVNAWAPKVSYPDYYRSEFSSEQERLILEITEGTAQRVGYSS